MLGKYVEAARAKILAVALAGCGDEEVILDEPREVVLSGGSPALPPRRSVW